MGTHENGKKKHKEREMEMMRRNEIGEMEHKEKVEMKRRIEDVEMENKEKVENNEVR